MLNLLQINLRKSKVAQDLLMQVAAERKIDVLLVSEQFGNLDTSSSYQDSSKRAGIIMHNKKLKVKAHQRTKFGFVWVEVNDVRIYSCYFPPYNDQFLKFKNDIDELKSSIAMATCEVLIAGDFNSKSP